MSSLWHPHCGSLQQLVEVQASRALLAFYNRDTIVVLKAKELVPRMFVLNYNTMYNLLAIFFCKINLLVCTPSISQIFDNLRTLINLYS